MKFIVKDNIDKQRLYDHLKFKEEYAIEVKDLKDNRTSNQNNYYWKCIVQVLGDELGYFSDEIHDILKSKFLSEYTILETQDHKTGVLAITGTSRLNTKEFEIYTEKVRIWALIELGIKLQLPNEYE